MGTSTTAQFLEVLSLFFFYETTMQHGYGFGNSPKFVLPAFYYKV